MDTWNTITHLSRTRLQRAQFVLETLCSGEMIPVLDLLRQWGKMSLAELSLATGETSVILEEQLGLLQLNSEDEEKIAMQKAAEERRKQKNQ